MPYPSKPPLTDDDTATYKAYVNYVHSSRGVNIPESDIRVRVKYDGIVEELCVGYQGIGREAEIERQHAVMASARKKMVGSGDRSERVRTYNFPQNRLTDHRINLTLYKLGFIMEGDLTEVLDALQHAREAEQLAELEVGAGS